MIGFGFGDIRFLVLGGESIIFLYFFYLGEKLYKKVI